MSQSKVKSTCMYCGSTAYGPGCAYSPHKRHVHISNGMNCIYCGSSSIGMGCPYNPFSKIHIRGAEYNNMMKESIYQSVMGALFLDRLTQPIESMEAYKRGLIDNKGRKIKEAVTEEEITSLRPLDQQILKIRRLINEDVIQLFKSNTLLEIASTTETFDVEKYKKEVKLNSRIAHVIENLREIFSDGVEQGFSKGYIENLIFESILKRYEST
jgi:hypothetical protein